MSRVTIYDMEEGVRYDAYTEKGKKLGVTYFNKDGLLYNDKGEAKGKYVGCTFVPADKAYFFEKIVDDVKPEIVEKSTQEAEYGLLKVVEGTVYFWERGYLSGDNFVLREGQDLFFCDKFGNRGAKVKADKIFLSDKFIPYSFVAPKLPDVPTEPKVFDVIREKELVYV